MVKTISFRFLKTLKFKVIFALVILTFGPIITFSFISLKQSYTALKQSEINKLVSKTNLLAVNANRYIEGRANQIRLISQADVFEGYKLKEIEVTMKEDQSGISFSFKDYGIGISKEDLKLLFDPFHRGKNVGNISGTGLGLSVLEKAVALHGGKITVESELGKGSTFNVFLPHVN